jgi:uncharacterized Fe-S cluster protein YjdI
MIKTHKKYKKYSKRKTNKKKRNLYDGSKKSKVLVFTHLGLGDMFLINGAVNYLATKYDKVHLVCRNDNKNVVEDMYSDNSSIKLILVKGEADMAPWESKCQSYIKDGFDIKSGGEFSMKASKKIYDYPNSYYDDMDIDRAVRKTHFHIPKREISKQLFETFKGRPYIVVHQEFSNGKIPIVEELIKRGEKRLIINLNNNEIDKNKDPEGYIIAKSYINRKSFSDYVDLFENADEIHLIDSSVYCFALHLNLDKVKRRLVYLRPGGSVIPDSFKLFEEVYDYKDQLQYDNYHRRQLSMKGGSKTVKIAFYSNHLGERGTEVALYDYAYFNKTLLNNESIIIYNKNNVNNNMKVIDKFKDKFNIFEISSDLNVNEIDEILVKEKCDIIYMIVLGEKIDIPTKAKVCIHSVFTCIDTPFGDVYALISPWICDNNTRYRHVPHMINLPNNNDNMRNKLNIPNNAVVYGRYGGFNEFNIEYVHKIVYNVAKNNSKIYFLFANTKEFCDSLPNIIHLNTITDINEKVKFINTCDAMLWARNEGETFGLAIGEFSTKNKPIICTKVGALAHEKILKDKGIWYDNNNLESILITFNKEENKKKDWNAYTDYTPEKVMKIFKEVFIDSTNTIKGGSNTNNRKISFITYGNDAFKQSKERIVNEAKDTGCFNGKIKAYGPDDLSKEFVDKVATVISMPRGGGYWIWKPYIIYDMLNKLNDNDILVYADAGCTLQKSAINRFNEYINMISPETQYSVLGMRLRAHNRDGSLKDGSLKSKSWTTHKIFDYFHLNLNSDIANKEMILGGVIICRKSPDSLAIFKKWLNVAEKQPDLFSDKYNEISKKQNNEFRENRHDQSIYSIILQIAPYNKSVKIINEEIEDVVNNDMFFIASKRRQGGGSRRAIKRYN